VTLAQMKENVPLSAESQPNSVGIVPVNSLFPSSKVPEQRDEVMLDLVESS